MNLTSFSSTKRSTSSMVEVIDLSSRHCIPCRRPDRPRTRSGSGRPPVFR